MKYCGVPALPPSMRPRPTPSLCSAPKDLPIHQEGCLTRYYYFFVALHSTSEPPAFLYPALLFFISPAFLHASPPSRFPSPGIYTRDWSSDEPWALADWLSLAPVIGRKVQSIGRGNAQLRHSPWAAGIRKWRDWCRSDRVPRITSSWGDWFNNGGPASLDCYGG